VTARADRVGIRLSGTKPLTFRSAATVPPEGTVRGAIEVPPDGQPIVLMADRPVTVGYPVVGVVTAQADLSQIAQARPGCVVSFVRD
jgi:allophanate hydrolase subunit 2